VRIAVMILESDFLHPLATGRARDLAVPGLSDCAWAPSIRLGLNTMVSGTLAGAIAGEAIAACYVDEAAASGAQVTFEHHVCYLTHVVLPRSERVCREESIAFAIGPHGHMIEA
jgi:hypothetical protein